MKSAIALLIKAVATFIATWISFSLFDNVFLTLIFIIAGLGTVLNYFIGDILILPRFGNIVASVSDGVLASITAYVVLLIANYNATNAIWIFGIIVAAFEFFFHMYLYKAGIVKKKDANISTFDGKKINYGTETGKEIHPYGDIWKPSNRSNDHDL